MNGSLSSLKQTKHIKARYYFIKDKIEEGEVNVRYCPTTEMWSDILNKPKHGTPFKKDHAMLMNVPIGYYDDLEFKNTHPALLPQEKNWEKLRPRSQMLPEGVCWGTSEIDHCLEFLRAEGVMARANIGYPGQG